MLKIVEDCSGLITFTPPQYNPRIQVMIEGFGRGHLILEDWAEAIKPYTRPLSNNYWVLRGKLSEVNTQHADPQRQQPRFMVRP